MLARGCVLAIVIASGCAGDLGDSAPYIEALERADASSPAPGDDEAAVENTPDHSTGCATAPPAFLQDPARCAGCHSSGAAPAGGLDLASPDLAGRLAGVAAICPTGLLADPKDPETSTLVLWTREGTDQCGAPSMPPVGAPLSVAEVECLITWIDHLDGVVDRVGGGTAP